MSKRYNITQTLGIEAAMLRNRAWVPPCPAHQGERECPRLQSFAMLAAVLVLVWMPDSLKAAAITWNTPVTISADTDVLNLGGQNYGYTWANTAASVNGVSFTGTSSQTGVGSNVSFALGSGAGQNSTTFSNPTGLSTAYSNLTKGAVYNSGSAVAVTVGNLISGHVYAAQFWVNDSRTAGSGRTESITSSGGNTVNLDYNSTEAAGGAGQYAIGRFTADATTQVFTIDGSSSTQINALQVRDVTGVWSGQTNGNWADASANFSGGSTWTTVSGLIGGSGTVYFGDTDGFQNAVSNSSVAIQSGGVTTGTVRFMNSGVNYTLTSADANGIGGSTAVNVAGAGTVTLLGTHAYTGTTTVASGSTLNIGTGATSGSISSSAISNAGALIFNSNSAVSHGGVISGAGSLTKLGTGTLTLSVNNTMTGPVTLDGGTLKYTADQTTAVGALTFGSAGLSANLSTLDLGATPSNLTASSLTVRTASAGANTVHIGAGKTLTAAGSVNIFNSAATTLGASLIFNPGGSVPTSTFAVTGASSFIFGQDSTTTSITRTSTLDMRNLGAFNAGTSGTALSNFVVGNYVQATGVNYNEGGIQTAYLAPDSTIYATSFGVGDKGSGAQPGEFNSTLYLGSGATAIHATTITVGEVGAISTGSTIKWNTGVTTGSLTLNGVGVTPAVSNMYVGYKTDTASSGAGTRLGTLDFSNGMVTGDITNLYIGYKPGGDSGTGAPATTGSFTLGAGAAGASSNLTIGNLTLAHSGQTVSSRNNPVNGTLRLDGGAVTVTNNIVLTNENAYDQRNGTLTITGGTLTVGGNISSGITRASSIINLSGGTLDMTSGNIGTATHPVSTFAYSSGTLSNPGSIYVDAATVTTVTADNKTINLASPNTFSVIGTGGFTLGADTGAVSTHKLTLTGSGAFSVKNASANVVIGVHQADANDSNTSTLDLSGLSSVTLGDSGTAINELRLGFGQKSAGTLTLSNTANTITASTIYVGNSNGANSTGSSLMTLGTGTNVIAADTINIGFSKSTGTLKFLSQTAGSPGTVTIGGKTTTKANFVIGSNNGTSTGVSASGTLDLRGHAATVTAGTVWLGVSNMTSGGGDPSGTIHFDTGTFTVDNLYIGMKSGADAGSVANGTLNLSGGTFTVNSGGAFTLASQSTAGSSAGTLNITGGVFTSNVDILDGGGSSTSTITLNGGTLDLAGNDIGTSVNPINALNFQSGTLRNVGLINGTAGFHKTTDGVLTLSGSNTFTGDVFIINSSGDAGDIIATHSGSFGVGPKTVWAAGNTSPNLPTLIFDGSAGDLSFAANINFRTSNPSLVDPAILNTAGNNRIQGPLQLDAGGGNSAIIVNGGTLELGAVSSVYASSGRTLILGGTASGLVSGIISNGSSTVGLQKEGAGTWTLTGANTFNGAVTINGGTLRVGAASGAATSGTLASNSITNNSLLIFRRTNAAEQDLAGAIGGTGAVVYEGSGASNESQYSANNASSYLGGTTIGNSRINLTNATGLGTGAVVINSGGQVFVNAAMTVANPMTISGNGWSESAGQLGALRLRDGSTVSGDITLAGNSRVTGNSGTSTISGDISGGFALEIGEDTTTGTLALSGVNSYTGETKLSYRILRLDSASALPGGIAASGGTSSLNFNGGVLGLNHGDFTRGTGTGAAQVKWTASGGFAAFGTDRTVNLGGAGATAIWNSGSFVPTGSALILGGSGAAGTLIFENPIDLGTATRTIQADDGTAAVDGRLTGILSGTGGISKSGAGTLELTADNSFTGTFGVTAGTLRLTGAAGSANNASGVAVSGGGTLLLDNTTNLGDRLKDSGTVSLAGGTLSFYHPAAASTNYSETTGALTVTGTANVVRTYQAADGQTSTLSFASLTYTPGALQFYGEGLGLSDGRNKILIGGSVPLSGGIIGGNASYFDGTTTGSAGYSLANGVVLYAPASSINVRGGVIPDLYTSVGITEAGSSGSMTLSAPVVTIQSLVQNSLSAGTLDLEGGTLRVGSVLIGSVSAPLTVGLVSGDGFLMADTNGGILSLNNNYATPLLVNAVIADHGGASSLVKTGGATVQLAAAATYTGATVISTGTLALVGSGALSDSTAVNLSDSSSVFDISAISGAGTEIGTLAGVAGSSVVLGGKTLTSAAGGTTTFDGVISGSGGSLAKYGGGILTLNGDNTFTGAVTIGGGTLVLNGNNEFAGTLTIGAGAKLSVPVILQSGVQPLGVGTSAIVFGGNASSGSELEYSGSASVILARDIHMAQGQGGTVNVSNASGVLTLTGELSGTSDFHKAGAGTMLISGGESWSGTGIVQEGTLIVGGAVSPGGNSISAGNWDITTGATLRINTTGAFEASSITRDGGLQLESGTLRTNALAGNGSFTWGNATLATLGNTTTGTVDRTDPAGSPSGPVVREGNILVYAGGLTTGGTSGAGSLLDLGSVLLNDGLRYNQISIGGSLDLSGVDTLNFSVNPYFLRPNTPDSVYTGDWGSLILVRAAGIAGEFDAITGIGNDAAGWRLFTPGQNGDPAFTTPGDLPLNTYYIEYATNSPDGAGALAGPAILFHYKVAGSVPEPASVGLMIGGAFLLRQLRRRRP